MIYAEKHLSLLSRMERDGLQLRFTGEFPEEILDQTCKKIEDMGLQEKLRKEEATQIQRELIQVPEFAELYQGPVRTGSRGICHPYDAPIGKKLSGALVPISEGTRCWGRRHWISSLP